MRNEMSQEEIRNGLVRPRKDGKTVKTENDRENISAQCCK